jgi:hypothetical protein
MGDLEEAKQSWFGEPSPLRPSITCVKRGVDIRKHFCPTNRVRVCETETVVFLAHVVHLYSLAPLPFPSPPWRRF